MNDTEYLSNGKIVFHSYDALKKYCDFPYNPLDKVILGEEITALNKVVRTYYDGSPKYEGLFEYSKRTIFSGIENWDVSNVTDMSCMFLCTKFFNQPIGNWDVSNVTDMSGMFFGAESFNQPIGDWDVSNVTDMREMFFGAKSFNQPIGDWDVSHVTDKERMFGRAEFFIEPLDNFTEKQKSDAYYFFDKERYASEQEKLTKTSSNSAENYADKVIKLAELKKQGLLTDEEFEMMKADLIKMK